jgi:hypothetical protein
MECSLGLSWKRIQKLTITISKEVAARLAHGEAIALNLHETVAVPLAKFRNCLLTKEFTQLEPGNVEHKFYARGIGFVLSVVVKGGKERLGLVNIVRNS